MEPKFTKREWEQRKLFESPILITSKDTGTEWYSNSIDIIDSTGRIICGVNYQTDSRNMGWGNNETIEKWEANAKLIAAAPNLLDACIEALEAIEVYVEDGYIMPGTSHENSLRKAIEKATQ